MNHGSKFVYLGESDDDEVSDSELEKGVYNVYNDEDNSVGASLFDDEPADPKAESGGFFSGLLSSIKSISKPTSSSSSSSSSLRRASSTTSSRIESDKREEAKDTKPVENNNNNNNKKSKKKNKVKKAKTNVVSVTLGTLASEATQISTGDPLFCKGCRAGFNIHSKLTDERKEGDGKQEEEVIKVWKCEFCGEVNSDINLAPEEMPTTESMDYLIEPAPETTSSIDESAIIFCLDTSGSMCVTTEVEGKFTLKGDHTKQLEALNTDRSSQRLPNEKRNVTYISRLQSLQAAVDAAMNKLVAESPRKRVGLVTFSNEVSIIGDGFSSETKIIAGDRLGNYEELLAVGEVASIAKPIKESRDKLHNRLYDLEENGATALGPAILASLSLASLAKAGSKVIICTDGKANVGLGALDNVNSEAAVSSVESWYSQVGHYAASKGICISVISIKGDDCRLEYLGKLAELTGGNVDIVNPLQITTLFSNILSKPTIATNTRCTVRLHKGLKISMDSEAATNHLVRDIGNIVSDTEFTFEYSVDKNAASGFDALPFQVQIEYQRPNGARLMRIVTQIQQTTAVRTQAEEEANVAVIATHVAQKSAQLAQEGEYGEARKLNVTHAKMFKRAAKTDAKRKVAQNWAQTAQQFYDDITTAKSSERDRGCDLSDEDDDAPNHSDEESKKRRNERKAKKNMQRKRERNDGYSNNIYQMKSAHSSMWD